MKKTRLELLILAQKEVENNLLRKQDLFDLLKKLLLNESQSFMLKNMELKVLIDKRDNENIKIFEQEKFEEKKKKLINYLNNKSLQNNISTFDIVLYQYLDANIKEEVRNRVSIK